MARDKLSMNIVVAGHVDHGKSTVIGRLLADAGALPEGKLESIRELCRRNAKPFEYAFLLDALKDERAQGITIDTARCFFETEKRKYIIIDAPGHIEFLKNMITGASRAEAALLVIDAAEGICENSRRHGYMLEMLGIRQIAVLVNKIDLVDRSRETYEKIKREYAEFLATIGIAPAAFIPVSATEGDNIAFPSALTPWYDGPTVLGQLDLFEGGDNTGGSELPLRIPVEDVYKFTEGGDDRRIVAGMCESGTLRAGDQVVFYPSRKTTVVNSLEEWFMDADSSRRPKEQITAPEEWRIRCGGDPETPRETMGDQARPPSSEWVSYMVKPWATSGPWARIMPMRRPPGSSATWGSGTLPGFVPAGKSRIERRSHVFPSSRLS